MSEVHYIRRIFVTPTRRPIQDFLSNCKGGEWFSASVPERLVQEVIESIQQTHECTVEEAELTQENVHFRIPAEIS